MGLWRTCFHSSSAYSTHIIDMQMKTKRKGQGPAIEYLLQYTATANTLRLLGSIHNWAAQARTQARVAAWEAQPGREGLLLIHRLHCKRVLEVKRRARTQAEARRRDVMEQIGNQRQRQEARLEEGVKRKENTGPWKARIQQAQDEYGL